MKITRFFSFFVWARQLFLGMPPFISDPENLSGSSLNSYLLFIFINRYQNINFKYKYVLYVCVYAFLIYNSDVDSLILVDPMVEDPSVMEEVWIKEW